MSTTRFKCVRYVKSKDDQLSISSKAATIFGRIMASPNFGIDHLSNFLPLF